MSKPTFTLNDADHIVLVGQQAKKHHTNGFRTRKEPAKHQAWKDSREQVIADFYRQDERILKIVNDLARKAFENKAGILRKDKSRGKEGAEEEHVEFMQNKANFFANFRENKINDYVQEALYPGISDSRRSNRNVARTTSSQSVGGGSNSVGSSSLGRRSVNTLPPRAPTRSTLSTTELASQAVARSVNATPQTSYNGMANLLDQGDNGSNGTRPPGSLFKSANLKVPPPADDSLPVDGTDAEYPARRDEMGMGYGAPPADFGMEYANLGMENVNLGMEHAAARAGSGMGHAAMPRNDVGMAHGAPPSDVGMENVARADMGMAHGVPPADSPYHVPPSPFPSRTNYAESSPLRRDARETPLPARGNLHNNPGGAPHAPSPFNNQAGQASPAFSLVGRDAHFVPESPASAITSMTAEQLLESQQLQVRLREAENQSLELQNESKAIDFYNTQARAGETMAEAFKTNAEAARTSAEATKTNAIAADKNASNQREVIDGFNAIRRGATPRKTPAKSSGGSVFSAVASGASSAVGVATGAVGAMAGGAYSAAGTVGGGVYDAMMYVMSPRKTPAKSRPPFKLGGWYAGNDSELVDLVDAFVNYVEHVVQEDVEHTKEVAMRFLCFLFYHCEFENQKRLEIHEMQRLLERHARFNELRDLLNDFGWPVGDDGNLGRFVVVCALTYQKGMEVKYCVWHDEELQELDAEIVAISAHVVSVGTLSIRYALRPGQDKKDWREGKETCVDRVVPRNLNRFIAKAIAKAMK